MFRTFLFALVVSFTCLPAFAVTCHISVTPKLAGENGVMMRPLDGNRTRFTIRVSTEDDPKQNDPRRPFVGNGYLDVRGELGQILRCSVQPSTKGRELIYSFDLDDEYAKSTWFILSEQFDDGQVGGGTVYSYRLIDFIDPGYRERELFLDLRVVDLSDLTLPPTLFPPKSDESESPQLNDVIGPVRYSNESQTH